MKLPRDVSGDELVKRLGILVIHPVVKLAVMLGSLPLKAANIT